ncbi:minor capsid protein [Streptococcus anginosus]|uniref:minor capsid protein n=1 Tax=Streptococcus anginosus TaxID=1328 RepID=UPI001244BD59|nr:minor capsid protein [Streptococcus anginosus]KAA9259771.1 capsid protein [Streptococcus anginosus]MDB8660501.1 minor capsid protein [Streptococcus anginosus]HEQ0291680.1 minor capsid protein [Streptococcus pyogenes]HES7273702.1 minor capsid protein [Streptococcus pyogenes]
MQNNDFSTVLLNYIKGLNLAIPARLDYLDETEDLVVYPLPGGKVEKEDLAGTQTVSLPFEIAIKSQDQSLNNAILWQINTALSKLDLDLPSLNHSYEFLSLDVAKPYLNDLDEKGFYVYLLDVTASLEIERK